MSPARLAWGPRPHCDGLYAALNNGREVHVFQDVDLTGWYATGIAGRFLADDEGRPIAFGFKEEAIGAVEREALGDPVVALSALLDE